jgi:hypothetical protein
MGKRFADLLLQRLVASLEFRKMRFNCHVAYLLASELLPTPYTSTTVCNHTPIPPPRKSRCASRQPRACRTLTKTR